MKQTLRTLLGYLGLMLLLGAIALPESSLACTVCMGGQEEASRKAFIGTTAFLTFLPLAIVGILVSIFFRKTLARERLEEAMKASQSEATGQTRPISRGSGLDPLALHSPLDSLPVAAQKSSEIGNEPRQATQ